MTEFIATTFISSLPDALLADASPDGPIVVLLKSLVNLLHAAFDVVSAAFFFLLPYLGLICWVGYWLLAVNWTKLYELFFKKGAIVSFGLLIALWLIVWCTVSPPADGYHDWFGFKVGNVVGKLVYVVGLVSLAFICGSIQLSGAVNRFIDFSGELEAEANLASGGHGHGGHGHDDHGYSHDDAGHGHHSPAVAHH